MVNQYCAHSFTRNWQRPFLNQWKGENDHRKYSMIQFLQKTVANSVGVEAATSRSPVKVHPTEPPRLASKRTYLMSPGFSRWTEQSLATNSSIKCAWMIHESIAFMHSLTSIIGLLQLRYCWKICLCGFYSPVNPMESCWAQSVYLTTLLLGRLSPLSN